MKKPLLIIQIINPTPSSTAEGGVHMTVKRLGLSDEYKGAPN
jgi:hypothetical protein